MQCGAVRRGSLEHLSVLIEVYSVLYPVHMYTYIYIHIFIYICICIYLYT